MRFANRSVAVAAFAATLALVPATLLAQDGTPEADETPVARIPPPEECLVDARSVDDIFALIESSRAEADPEATREPLPAPLGEPASPEVAQALEATARELISCLNAGDIPRATSLFADSAVGPVFGPAPSDPDAARAALEAEPEPLPSERQTRLLAVADPSILDDGRAAAFVIVNDPLNPPRGPEALLLTFVEEGDRWLIDGLIDFSVVPDAPAGTPTGTPAP